MKSEQSSGQARLAGTSSQHKGVSEKKRALKGAREYVRTRDDKGLGPLLRNLSI